MVRVFSLAAVGLAALAAPTVASWTPSRMLDGEDDGRGSGTGTKETDRPPKAPGDKGPMINMTAAEDMLADQLGDLSCEMAQPHVDMLVLSITQFRRWCGGKGDETYEELKKTLLMPHENFNKSMACEKKCMGAIMEPPMVKDGNKDGPEDGDGGKAPPPPPSGGGELARGGDGDGDEGGDEDDHDGKMGRPKVLPLLAAGKRLMEFCGGRLSSKGAAFFQETIERSTWGQVRDNFMRVEDSTKVCKPVGVDDAWVKRCEKPMEDMQKLLDDSSESEDPSCGELLKDLRNPESVHEFCTANVTQVGGEERTCDKLMSHTLKKLAESRCEDAPVFDNAREQITGVCKQGKNGERCFHEVAQFKEERVMEELDILRASKNFTGLDARIKQICGASDCVKNAAKQQRAVGDADMPDFSLMCKKGSKGGNCYNAFMQSLGGSPLEVVEAMCTGERCGQRVAPRLLADADLPDSMRSQLEGLQKYACVKDEVLGNCVTKVLGVFDPAKDVGTKCASSIASGTCEVACQEVVSTIVEEAGCCLSPGLAYLEYAGGSWSLARTAVEACGATIPDGCKRVGNFKKRKALKLCGVKASILNTTEGLEAIKNDIYSTYGITEENLLNLEVVEDESACGNEGSSASSRRALEEASGSTVQYDIAGLDQAETEEIVGSVSDTDIDLSSTLEVVYEADPTVESLEIEPTTEDADEEVTGAPTMSPTMNDTSGETNTTSAPTVTLDPGATISPTLAGASVALPSIVASAVALLAAGLAV